MNQSPTRALPAVQLSSQPRLARALLLVLVGLSLFLLRAVNAGQAYEIFIDEITYLRLAQSVAESGRVLLGGEPFYLHPPAFFFLEAAYLQLVSLPEGLIAQVQSVRVLNLLLGALSGLLLFLIAERAAGLRAAVIVALLFAVDPFIIRNNSRNLLDTSAIFWALLGYWLLVGGMARERTTLGRGRVLLVGLCFGLALLTKEMMAFLTLLPLALLAGLRWSLARASALGIGAVALATYAIYPLAVFIGGDGRWWVEDKFRGILRLAGFIQETGMNRDLGISFLQAIVGRLVEFGFTYLLIGLGVAALVYLIRQQDAIFRLLALWAASAYALLAYLIPFGTLEEQFFYFLIVPAVLVIAVAFALYWKRAGDSRGPIVAGALLLGFAFFGWSMLRWSAIHFSPSNGYEQAMAFVEETVPADARVASTSEVGQFLLEEYGSGPWGDWHSVEALAEHDPDYLLVNEAQVAWDFGDRARPLYEWLATEGTLVWEFEDVSGDRIWVYELENGK